MKWWMETNVPSLKIDKSSIASLIANESVEDYTRQNKKGVIVKLDLEKAYDRTDWDFLEYTMAKKGLGSKWRSWVHGYLSTALFPFF